MQLREGLYQICKYFLANLQIAKLHFANLHFTHPSFYQTFFVQTYNLPNTFCQTYIFQIFGKLTNFLHCAKSSFCQTFILPNPSVCSNTKNGAAIILGQVRLSPPQGLDSARSAGVETCQVQLAQVRCNWPRLGAIGSVQVQLAQVRCNWLRLGATGPGQVKLAQVRCNWLRLGATGPYRSQSIRLEVLSVTTKCRFGKMKGG